MAQNIYRILIVKRHFILINSTSRLKQSTSKMSIMVMRLSVGRYGLLSEYLSSSVYMMRYTKNDEKLSSTSVINSWMSTIFM